MKVGQKLTTAVAVVSAVSIGITYIVVGSHLRSSYQKLQLEEAQFDLDRSRDAVENELRGLGTLANDWGAWDDSFRYVQGKNTEFESVNLLDAAFSTSNFDVCIFTDNAGNLIWGKYSAKGKIQPLNGLIDYKTFALGDAIKPGPARSDHAAPSGIIKTPLGPLALVARPVRDSELKSSTKGAIFMGRFLTPERIERMAIANRIKFELEPNLTLAPSNLTKEHPVVPTTFEGDVSGFAYLGSLNGTPTYLLKSITRPRILQQGEDTLGIFLASLGIISLISSLAVIGVTRRSVAKPIEQLAQQIKVVGETGDADLKLDSQRKDEIGDLARGFDEMLSSLNATQSKLLSTSREAGMAEVARNVLHNAGNVLNSISVSVGQLEQIGDRRTHDKIGKLTQLLNKQPDLAAYFAEDPKAAQALPYLNQVNELLQAERGESWKELTILRTNVAHLGQIVQNQQAFATKQNHREPVQVGKIVEAAILMLRDSFGRHGVQIFSDVAKLPTVETDPSRLSQVLVNLLTNAKDALKDLPLEHRHMSVCAGQEGNEIVIRIHDRGIGMSAETITKIFQSGFTTKSTGMGHGLHYCANSATEMGWTLSAESPGEGKGSTFILAIPIEATQEKAA